MIRSIFATVLLFPGGTYATEAITIGGLTMTVGGEAVTVRA